MAGVAVAEDLRFVAVPMGERQAVAERAAAQQARIGGPVEGAEYLKSLGWCMPAMLPAPGRCRERRRMKSARMDNGRARPRPQTDGILSLRSRHESFAVPAHRAHLGHHLDRHQAADGPGGDHPVDRLPLRPGGAGAVRRTAARPPPAKAGRTGPTPVHGPGRMPVLPEFHLLLYRQPVDSQRPGGRGVLHRHPVECAERPPVVRPAHRVERDGRWRSRPARPGAAVLAGIGGSPGHPGNLLRPRPGPARHAVLLHRQHAFQPATEGRHPPAHRQCLEHALWHPDPPGAVPVPGRAAEFRLERATSARCCTWRSPAR